MPTVLNKLSADNPGKSDERIFLDYMRQNGLSAEETEAALASDWGSVGAFVDRAQSGAWAGAGAALGGAAKGAETHLGGFGQRPFEALSQAAKERAATNRKDAAKGGWGDTTQVFEAGRSPDLGALPETMVEGAGSIAGVGALAATLSLPALAASPVAYGITTQVVAALLEGFAGWDEGAETLQASADELTDEELRQTPGYETFAANYRGQPSMLTEEYRNLVKRSAKEEQASPESFAVSALGGLALFKGLSKLAVGGKSLAGAAKNLLASVGGEGIQASGGQLSAYQQGQATGNVPLQENLRAGVLPAIGNEMVGGLGAGAVAAGGGALNASVGGRPEITGEDMTRAAQKAVMDARDEEARQAAALRQASQREAVEREAAANAAPEPLPPAPLALPPGAPPASFVVAPEGQAMTPAQADYQNFATERLPGLTQGVPSPLGFAPAVEPALPPAPMEPFGAPPAQPPPTAPPPPTATLVDPMQAPFYPPEPTRAVKPAPQPQPQPEPEQATEPTQAESLAKAAALLTDQVKAKAKPKAKAPKRKPKPKAKAAKAKPAKKKSGKIASLPKKAEARAEKPALETPSMKVKGMFGVKADGETSRSILEARAEIERLDGRIGKDAEYKAARERLNDLLAGARGTKTPKQAQADRLAEEKEKAETRERREDVFFDGRYETSAARPTDGTGDAAKLYETLFKEFGSDGVLSLPLRIVNMPDEKWRGKTTLGSGGADSIILNSARIGEGEVRGVFMHEVGVHFGLRNMLGEAEFAKLIRSAKRDATGWRDASARVPDNTPDAHKDEEALARLVQMKPKSTRAKRLMVGARRFLRTLGVKSKITDDELTALAEGAVRHAMLSSSGERVPMPTALAARTEEYKSNPLSLMAEAGELDPAIEKLALEALGEETLPKGFEAELIREARRLNGKVENAMNEALKNTLTLHGMTKANLSTFKQVQTLRQTAYDLRDSVPALNSFMNIKRNYDADVGDGIAEINRFGAKAENFVKDHADEVEALGEVLHEGTMMRFDPGKADLRDDMNGEEYKLFKKYQSLSKEAKGMHREITEKYAELFDKLMDSILESLKQHSGHSPAIKEVWEKFESSMRKKRIDPYVALTRYGNFYVAVKKGGVKHVYARETAGEQRKLIESLVNDGHAETEMDVWRDTPAMDRRENVPDKFAAKLIEALPEEAHEIVREIYLQMSAAGSVRGHLNRRKGVPGFDPDYMKNLFHYWFETNKRMTTIKYIPLMKGQIETLDKQLARKPEFMSLKKYHELKGYVDLMNDHLLALTNPHSSRWADVMTRWGFTWFLGFSPSSAMLNMTQVAMVTLPYLGGRYGNAKAAKEMAIAYKTLFSGLEDVKADRQFSIRGKLKGDESKMYDWLEKQGLIDFGFAQEVMGYRETGLAFRSKQFTFMKASAYMFSHAERYNREITALVTYRLARQRGLSENKARQEVRDVIDKTQFYYGREERPGIMRNPAMVVMTQFMMHAQGMLYLYSHLAKRSLKGESKARRLEASRQLAGMLLVSFVVSGATYWTLASATRMLANALSRVFRFDDDEDEDGFWEALRVMGSGVAPFSKGERYTSGGEIIANKVGDATIKGAKRGENPVGETLYNLIQYGVIDAAFGTAAHRRMSTDPVQLLLQMPTAGKRDDIGQWLPANVPALSIAEGWLRGISDIMGGRLLKGVEQMTPRVVSDAVGVARRRAQGGDALRNGVVRLSAEEISLADDVRKLLGLGSLKESRLRDRSGRIRNRRQHYQQKMTRYYTRLYTAWRNSDAGTINKVVDEIIRFAERNDYPAPSRQAVFSALRARIRQEQGYKDIGHGEYNRRTIDAADRHARY